MRIVFMLSAFMMLSSACVKAPLVVPDPTVPHQVASEAEVEIWARMPDGKLARETVRILPGWWIAGPPVVEPMPVTEDAK